jgi:3-isopropylmalate dehydrogenase
MSQIQIVAAPGDGVGPEITATAIDVVNATAAKFGHEVRWIEESVGAASIDRSGTALQDGVLDRVRESGGMLFGAVGDPRFDRPDAPVRPEQAILGLREGLGLFANLRPVRAEKVDLLIVRELTGGIYFGKPRERGGAPGQRHALDTCVYTEPEVARVVELAFSVARGRGRRVTSVDKANVLATSQLWREISTEIGEANPDIALDHRYVDSCAMDLVRTPHAFDVMVTGNLFGDILSDLAAVLAGSIGLLPSASLGHRQPGGTAVGLYEPIHGSAPDIAGQDRANPVGTILSAGMMLRYSYGMADEAEALEAAVEQTLAAGFGTADVRGAPHGVGTREFGTQVAQRLANPGR